MRLLVCGLVRGGSGPLESHAGLSTTAAHHFPKTFVYAGASGSLEPTRLAELVDDALRIQEESLVRHGVTVIRDYPKEGETVAFDKTRVMQILVNLVENARQAMDGIDGPRELVVAVWRDDQWLSVSVRDCGCGIAPDKLTKIFSHGFTTKPGGHGFGLHSCAVAAKEMGGTLSVQSGGVDAGTTFTLRLPMPVNAQVESVTRRSSRSPP